MGYLKAVLNNNTKEEIKNLRILISSGKKLNKNTSKYESEIKKHNVSTKKHFKIEPIKIEKPTKLVNAKLSKIDTNKYKYSIKSVVSKDNMVVIDFNTNVSKEYIKFHEKKVKGHYQDIFDIRGKFKDAYPTKLALDGVKQIVINQQKSNSLRILFEDKKNLKTIYIVNNKQIIIKVLNTNTKPTKSLFAKISKSPKIVQTGRNRVIVLDAGHGGKDSGAVGGKKKYEKDVVFKVTKYLESTLKNRGYKVYLTRNDDKFIKVKNRTILANKKKADIFISIHANAAHKTKVKKMQGVETFFLSPARSERAKRVAAKENKSDIRTMSGSTKQAFLESLNRPRITASHKLSIDLQKNMLFSTRQLYKDVVDSGVREGPFWVLVGAQMPSVLIELGYITHPTEGKRLFYKNYQKKLALGIANGIDAYFAKNP